jgi:hypothetical protein
MKDQKGHKSNIVYTILAIFAGVSLLILAIAIAYYLMIYLPKKDIQKLDYENKQKQEQQVKKKSDYDACMIKALATRREGWLKRCKANNKPIIKSEDGYDTCLLPDYMSQIVTDQYYADKEACLKIYQAD